MAVPPMGTMGRSKRISSERYLINLTLLEALKKET